MAMAPVGLRLRTGADGLGSSRRITPGHRLAGLVVALCAAGCVGGGALVPPPPFSAAPLAVEAPLFEPVFHDAPLGEPPEHEELVDELLASPVLRDPEFTAAVDDWVVYWRRSASRSFPDFVRRMGHFGSTVDSALAAERLPPSLRYLPFIESGYNPSARSRASAVGLWQFMAGTAEGLGMEVTPLIDERRNPYKSTAGAVRFLSSLHDEFGSWYLVLAANNGGPTRTRRILDRHAPLAQPSDSLFWALRRHFPRETREFLPKLIGAIVVASDPAAHGYEVELGGPFAFDEVEVPDATTLDVVAKAAGASLDEIERLNPELVRGITPPGRAYRLRVPEGAGPEFTTAYALIPPEERVSFVEHRVASGETLSHIARRYRISVADLQAANPGVRPRYLRVGARLTVPLAPSARRAG